MQRGQPTRPAEQVKPGTPFARRSRSSGTRGRCRTRSLRCRETNYGSRRCSFQKGPTMAFRIACRLHRPRCILPEGFVGFARLLTFGELAAQLESPPRHPWCAADSGDLPVVRVGPQTVRLMADDVAVGLQHAGRRCSGSGTRTRMPCVSRVVAHVLHQRCPCAGSALGRLLGLSAARVAAGDAQMKAEADDHSEPSTHAALAGVLFSVRPSPVCSMCRPRRSIAMSEWKAAALQSGEDGPH